MSLKAYYNENDPKAAAWLRELIKQGAIADGEVDERSIEDVLPGDVAGFTQCHFFAGIGGWSYALRLAGWPDGRAVWTGSCPCQPFSAAGQGKGFADERHLWPAWFHLISTVRPDVIFGEQVASKSGLAWLDLVSHDFAMAFYASGFADIPAASVGAPHFRQRIYFVAESQSKQYDGSWDTRPRRRESTDYRIVGDPSQSSGGRNSTGVCQSQVEGNSSRCADGGFIDGPWTASDWLECIDGKRRPVEPGTLPLAHGISARMGRVRGYGNAILPQAGAQFIAAYSQSAKDSQHG